MAKSKEQNWDFCRTPFVSVAPYGRLFFPSGVFTSDEIVFRKTIGVYIYRGRFELGFGGVAYKRVCMVQEPPPSLQLSIIKKRTLKMQFYVGYWLMTKYLPLGQSNLDPSCFC